MICVPATALHGFSTVCRSAWASRRSPLIGRNGMGKTTLCNTIMGLVRASSGEIHFNGERIDSHVPEKVASSVSRMFRRDVDYSVH